jgi:GGDEF domain-containing protein
MPGTNLLQAVAIAEPIWREFDARARPGVGGKFSATVSAGVASFPGRDVRDAEELLRASDHAMGYAKRGGADRVCGFLQHGLVYTPPSIPAVRGGSRAD